MLGWGMGVREGAAALQAVGLEGCGRERPSSVFPMSLCFLIKSEGRRVAQDLGPFNNDSNARKGNVFLGPCAQ